MTAGKRRMYCSKMIPTYFSCSSSANADPQTCAVWIIAPLLDALLYIGEQLRPKQ